MHLYTLHGDNMTQHTTHSNRLVDNVTGWRGTFKMAAIKLLNMLRNFASQNSVLKMNFLNLCYNNSLLSSYMYLHIKRRVANQIVKPTPPALNMFQKELRLKQKMMLIVITPEFGTFFICLKTLRIMTCASGNYFVGCTFFIEMSRDPLIRPFQNSFYYFQNHRILRLTE